MKMHTAYLALGSNLGDKDKNLQTAIAQITKTIGTPMSLSSIHTSEPWGYRSNNVFRNQVIKVETPLTPHELLHAIQTIEKQMGRTPKKTPEYEDRIIDVDIILYDQLHIRSEELTIPHPLYQQRPFVTIPLNEIL
jgi:2-amino-4-hydroxy-6-hydroxymethyldihydropteridine diphosphokinase